MKFSEQWLREWVNPPIDTQQLAEQLTMAGLETESVTPVASDFSKVVIGKVLSAEQHPNAERLRVCQVDIGHAEQLTIVCGGANVRAGLKVPVVLVGGSIKGQPIKEAKLRGLTSQGMICSMAELGLQETSQGIMELSDDAPIGEDFRVWLKLADHAIDLHVTPNRGDCLSITGIAREVAVLNNEQFTLLPEHAVAATIPDKFAITVHTPVDCPRYLGRIIRDINPQATTPLWMVERLRRSGLRSIHPVVDVTNYVMLELGQPLHAFDLAKLQGAIQVRRANAGETIVLLDGQTVNLDADVLVIADAEKPQAIAGIMGGIESAVGADTMSLFLESAFFNPLTITGRARRLGVSSDASHRFERGVDPSLSAKALERATQLLVEIVGGKAGPITEVTNKDQLPKSAVILLRKARIQRVLGIAIADADVENILQRLGMQLEQKTEGWQVISPAHRFDIAIEADLIEEVARIYGYARIPKNKPPSTFEFMPLPENQILVSRLRHVLLDRGYHEAITYSFVAPKLQQLIDPSQPVLELINPISAELSVMRTTLWSGLLSAVAYNQNRQQNRVRLFETGLRFLPGANQSLKQEAMLAGVASGSAYPEQWGMPQKPIDFYDVKADLEILFALTGSPQEFSFIKAEHPALHPGQSCAIMRAGQNIGYLGALHPALLQQLSLNGAVYCFELQLAALHKAALPHTQVVSKFPIIRRDISFWINIEIPVQQLVEVIQKTVGELLVDLLIFDVYQGKEDKAGLRSIALGLLLQHPTRTLVDDEVNTLLEKLLAALRQNFAISLRE